MLLFVNTPPPQKKPQTNKQNKAKQNKTIVSRKHVQQLNRSGRCYGPLDLIWFDLLCLTQLLAISQLYHGDQF
jgi:hypothetical protein